MKRNSSAGNKFGKKWNRKQLIPKTFYIFTISAIEIYKLYIICNNNNTWNTYERDSIKPERIDMMTGIT